MKTSLFALEPNDRKVFPLIAALSLAVPLLVLALMLMPESWRLNTGIEPHILPLFHAVINGTTALLLLLGLYYVRQHKIGLHRLCMLLALFLSVVFLLSYVVSKLSHAPVPYGGTGLMRSAYYVVLVSHIILTLPLLPLALTSVYRAFTGQIAQHKKLVRWTFPIWLYVAITGVLVYVFMAPYYG
ncbi:DUF420 domain-containing protein [bacterium]|nr:DUF420 domain-containing protein [bacterium]